MAVYNIHGGHNKIVPGAGSYLDEVTEDRKITAGVIALLRAQGHTVYDCTDDAGRTAGANLANIVAKCNAHNAAIDVSIHLNAAKKDAGDGKTKGTEVFVYSASSGAKNAAARVCANMAALGFTNRGVRVSTSLYVLRKTNAPAMLIEVCFVDDKDDADLYNKVGVNAICKAIASAIVNTSIPTNVAQSTASVTTNTNATTKAATGEIAELQAECNAQGFSNQKVDNIPGPITLAGCPTLKVGARGNITKWVQRKLNALGYNCGALDGIFGAKTAAAVMAFQRANGLVADGIVGQKTWSKLLGLS